MSLIPIRLQLRHLSYFFFPPSLTTDMNRDSWNTRVPAVQPGNYKNAPGVRVHHFLLLTFCHVNSRLQIMTTLQEGNQWQMWEFIRVE